MWDLDVKLGGITDYSYSPRLPLLSPRTVLRSWDCCLFVDGCRSGEGKGGGRVEPASERLDTGADQAPEELGRGHGGGNSHLASTCSVPGASWVFTRGISFAFPTAWGGGR